MTAALLAASSSSSSLGASGSYYRAATTGYAGDVNLTTEAVAQTTCRTAGTYSQLQIVVATNDRAASTLTFRKNGAAGNQSVSITGSTTGAFTDVTNTDTVVAGDKVNLLLSTGTGGTTLTTYVSSVLFDAGGSGTVARLAMVNPNAAAISTAAQTSYANLAGRFTTPSTTETNEQWLARLAGTLQNLGVNVSTNSSTAATTINSRKNAAAGNLSVSIGAAATGWFEDTTHSDSFTSGDLINYQIVSSTGTASIVLASISAELVGPSAQYQLVNAGALSSGALGLALTAYFPLGGGLTGGSSEYSTTETQIAQTVRRAVTLSNLDAFVTANTITAASTFALRKNGAAGNQSISITASTTGRFEDTTHTDSVASTDTLDYQIVTGATGTTLTLRNMGVLVSASLPLAGSAVGTGSGTATLGRNLQLSGSAGGVGQGSATLTPGTAVPPPAPAPSFSVLVGLAGYRIRVRDASLNVVGELDDYQQLTLNLIFNDVSRWQLTVRPGTSAVDALRTPGAGIIVQRLHPGYTDDGKVVLSGVWDSFVDVYDDQGLHLEVAGPDDMYVVQDELAYPSIDGNFANNAYDVFGPAAAETVLYHYASGNIGPTAITSRKTPGGRPAITLASDLGRGSSLTGRARFGQLLDTLQAYALASVPELGFRVVQSGSALQFQVYQPVDRSTNVKFGPDLGNVQAYQRTATAPTVNHVIVGGGGVGTARSFLENEDATAISTWKRRIVSFRDQRNTTDIGELSQAATETLNSGVALTALDITPIDTPTQQYLIDYGLGDKVTVVTHGAAGQVNTVSDLVRQVNIQLQGGQSTQVQPTVGQPSSAADPVAAKQADLEKRLLALESVQ